MSDIFGWIGVVLSANARDIGFSGDQAAKSLSREKLKVIELYFLFYRIPKMMGELARKQGRSPVLWGGAAIVAWIFSEVAVIFGVTIGYAIAALSLDLPREQPALLKVLMYLLAIGSAIGSVALLHFILRTRSPRVFIAPPPPPSFS